MKKGVKILIILLFMIIIGLVTYIVLDKTVLSNNGEEEESKKSSSVTKGEENVGDTILAEINKKEFLAKNGIEEEDVGTFEYCVVETKKNPIYIVKVGYQAEGEASHGKIFQVIYKDGKVIFDVIEDHKYLSDTIEYDSNKEILKLEATYHGGTRTNYYELSNGQFEGIDLAVADGSKEYYFEELKTTKLETSKKTNNEENKTVSKTYTDLQGTYEGQGANVNEGTELEPYYISHILVLSKEGTFAYYYTDTDCHNVGYYTIDGNKLTFYSVVETGNDPSAGLSNQKFEFTLNSDGTITAKDNVKVTRKSETPREDTNIANLIDQYMAGCTTSGKDGQGPWFSGLPKE